MQTDVMTVRGMRDENAALQVLNTLKAVPGVSAVDVSLAVNEATVQFDEDRTSSQELQATLERAGFVVGGSTGKGCGGGCCGGCGG